MTYNNCTSSQSYLEHHGIKGQKWGQRRYQNEDGSLTAQGRQRYGVVERAKIRFRGYTSEKVNVMNNVRRAKGIGNKVSALAGYDRLRTRGNVRATTEKNLANASRTRLGKAIHTQRSENAKHQVKYAQTMRHKSFGKKVIENSIWAGEAMKTPYTRLSGRQTTVGKQVVDNLLTGGIYGLTQDVKYLSEKKKTGNS